MRQKKWLDAAAASEKVHMMEQLRKLVAENSFQSSKVRKQANGILRKCLASEGGKCVPALVEMFFGCTAVCGEPEFLNMAYVTILSSDHGGSFIDDAKARIEQSFWGAEKPAISAFVNFCHLPGDFCVFDGKECEFIFIIVKYLCEFPASCFVSLRIVINKFASHLREHDIQIPEELLQQVDDAFDMKKPQTILATYLIKVGEMELPCHALDSMFKSAVDCLISFCDATTILELRTRTVMLFAVALRSDKFLLLQSHFMNAIKSDGLTSKFLEKCVELLKISHDPSALCCLYQAFSNCFSLSECMTLIHFMKRDFETSSNDVRLVLQSCFAKLCEMDIGHMVELCTPIVTEMPWYSKLKRFMFPLLFCRGNNSLVQDLIALAQNPQSKGYVGKCIEAASDITFLAEGISRPRTGAVRLDSIFAHNVEIPKACLECLPSDRSQRISMLQDAVICFPRHFAGRITIDDVDFGMNSFDVDMRIRAFSAFLAAGYPKNEHDCDVFCRCFDKSLLMIDSVAEQRMIPNLFEQLSSGIMVRERKKGNLPLQKFFGQLLSACCKRLVPTSNDIQRQLCLSMCGSIWKRFPDLGKKADLARFNTTLVHGQATLKKAALDIARLLPKVEVQITTRKIECGEVPGAEAPFQDLRNFRILVEKNGMKGTDEIVSDLISRAESYEEKDWETKSELYLILCNVKCSLGSSCAIATSLFKSLMNTRKAGFIGGCYLALKKVLQQIKSNEDLIVGFAKDFIASFSDFDMAQMRRSAGLPFISVSLMGSTENVLRLVLDGLLSLGETTANEQEETNVINTLKPTVREHSLDLSVLSRIFALLFDACYRFSSSWDVKSAVDLVFVTLLLKIWEVLATETVLRNLSRYRFFSEVQGSRDIVKKALESANTHAIYLALLLLRHFPSDAGDPELADLVEKAGDSTSSRIRRTAARALVSVVSIDNREALAARLTEALSSDRSNLLHFHLLVLCELQSLGIPVSVAEPVDTRNCPMLKTPLNQLQKLEPEWQKQNIGGLVVMLRSWPEAREPPQDLLSHLTATLVTPELSKVNEALQIEGLRFLGKTLPPNSLTPAQGSVIIDLIKGCDSVELQAALIPLLLVVQGVDLCDFIDFAFENASNPFEAFVPIQMALSSIAGLLGKVDGGKAVLFFLLLNDIPKIRRQTAYNGGLDVKSEIVMVRELVQTMECATKRKIVERWVHLLESRLEESEPLTFYVDELEIFYMLCPECEAKFWNSVERPLSIQEMRREIITLQDIV